MKINFNKLTLRTSSTNKLHFGKDVYQINKEQEILYSGEVIGKIQSLTTSLGMKYISFIEIDEDYRSFGIGEYILSTYFKGYFISAGNERVRNLYSRIGRDQYQFTNEECRTIAYNTGMWGTYIIE